MLDRLAQNWVYGGVLFAPVLLVLIPVFGLSTPGTLCLLALVVYMVHQYEEHDDDRFARFMNGLFGPNRAGLTQLEIMIINVVGVWVFLALGTIATETLHAGWALFAAYLLLINGLSHIGQAARLKGYNPGLWTAIVLFLPLSAVLFIRLAGTATLVHHVVSAGIVVALHLAIVARGGRARAP